MKFIKLTNATKGRIGEELLLNTDLIASFFENTQEDGNKVVVAYGLSGNSWEVQDDIDSIMEQLNN